MRRSKFLNYDYAALCNHYRQEPCLLGRLPYRELHCFLDEMAYPGEFRPRVAVQHAEPPFTLASAPPDRLSELQAHAFEEFVREKRVDQYDSPVVGVRYFDQQSQTLGIQRCLYSDGLKSNYAMDYISSPRPGGGETDSLRSHLIGEYGARLPPLDDRRLSNAMGLAAIVWYRHAGGGGIAPYLPRRAGGSATANASETDQPAAVFHGGFHCTASGEAEWMEDATGFDELFTAGIRKELSEEVGLEKEDLEWIVPVALCREFLRGGKPQLFFAGLTKASASDLAEKRRAAIKRQIEAGRQEVLDEALPVESPAQVYRDLARHGTIEAYVNMIYSQRCIALLERR